MKDEISNKAYSVRDRRGGASRLKRRSRFLRNPRIARPVRLKSRALKSCGRRPFKDSGIGANVWSKTLNIDNQYHSVTPDEDHCNKTAIFDGSTPKIIEQTDYLGLLSTLKYGTINARDASYI